MNHSDVAHREIWDEAQVIVFDFDGTLVDSTDIKWRAFETIFEEFPDHLEEITNYCRGFNHTPRDVKFRYVCETILTESYTAERATLLHDNFEKITTEAIVRAPEIPGAEEFLFRAKERYETVVLSSTPHDILIDILERRGWMELFDHYQGAPVNKASWLTRFQVSREFKHSEIVFFGDMPEDAASARSVGCHFIGVANEELKPGVGYFVMNYLGLLD